MRVVVEGAHTPSGQLAADTFKELGATVVLINGDIQEIDGEHTADPSKEENLVQLRREIITENADFGVAFDLDGDRGAIIVPQRSLDTKEVKFITIPPDNLIVCLMPFYIKNRFMFRASSNDPTFVCSFETPVWEEESLGSETVHIRYVSVGGVVLDWLEKNQIALVTGDIEYTNREDTEKVVNEYREKLDVLESEQTVLQSVNADNVEEILEGGGPAVLVEDADGSRSSL